MPAEHRSDAGGLLIAGAYSGWLPQRRREIPWPHNAALTGLWCFALAQLPTARDSL
jgi:hypothetical protein